MKRRPSQILFVFLLLAACAPTSRSSLEPVEPVSPTPAVPSFLLPGERVIVHSASYSITVRDPARALAELRRAVEQAGGYVTNASTWSGEGSSSSASLSAKVPPGALTGLGEAVERIADEVQSGSTYVQDVTSEVLKLQTRRRELTRAQEHLFSWLAQTRDPEADTTYRILSGLLENELYNVESQLDSYAGQSDLASFDVSLYQPEAVSVIIE